MVGLGYPLPPSAYVLALKSNRHIMRAITYQDSGRRSMTGGNLRINTVAHAFFSLPIEVISNEISITSDPSNFVSFESLCRHDAQLRSTTIVTVRLRVLSPMPVIG